MKKTQIFLLLIVLTVTISALSFRKGDIQAASRGKVVADKSSGLFDMKLNEASFFSIIMGNSAIEDIEGNVCVLDENDQPTGEYIRMVPRSFPSWFVFGCEEGTIITYKIVEKGNGEKQAIVKVGKKPK
jgi:hypothetical protein